MSKDLVIVESPAKSKTLGKFLGKGFKVEASGGHIKDLPVSKLGVDVTKNFAPEYVVIKGKSKIISRLKNEAKKASKIYLAPDPDREGEAIAWHIAGEMKKVNSKIYRASFNEITKKAVLEGLKSAGKIDMDKVKAQQARRILDRLVGYKISPILWKTVYRGLSAGRVQSVALRMICEREEEIEKFVPQEYWSLTAWLETERKESFPANLVKINDAEAKIGSQKEVEKIVQDLEKQKFRVADIRKEARKRHPYPPYITSTLQQDAARRLNFSSYRTMKIAQQLYEGVELGEVGDVGLITYMRTDSVRIADIAKEEAKNFIKNNFGSKYVPSITPSYKSRKGAQEAHEAIRPTYVEYSPDKIARYLSKEQYRLYELIWNRFVASQMRSAEFSQTSVDINAGTYLFRATSSEVLFDGFLRVYREIKEENSEEEEEFKLPGLVNGEILGLSKLDPKQHFTKPAPRFTEASLIKELEANGIGRPSTYAQILTTIKQRKYVDLDVKRIFPTELGKMINKILVDNFPDIFEVKFTAKMEEELDKIEEGKDDWVKVLNDFYVPFQRVLKEVEKRKTDMKNMMQEETDEVCDKCNSKMIVKWGRHGKFLACSNYPNCKNTKPLNYKENEKIALSEKCEVCGSPMEVKFGRFGRFLACSKYPECKNTKPISIGIKCPEQNCGGEMVEKRTKRGRIFYGCSNYPKCKFAVWDKPISQVCPTCGSPILVEKIDRSKGSYLKCIRCDYKKEKSPEETKVLDSRE
ncbi:MAG: type I DNA topoisomerase [candidate division Zixibacteria bacterium]|nr:type I DNA topoisomerase [candidate division Zixibacteria bacterium]